MEDNMEIDTPQSDVPLEFVFNGNNVRVVMKNGEPWWVNNDVCAVLNIANPWQAISRLDTDERDDLCLTDAMGRAQKTSIINEAGLYSLILSSRKPEAKIFKRWITHEVIPSIRKHGAYMTPPTIDSLVENPDLIIELCNKLKKERQLRAEEEAKRLKAEREKAEAIRTKAMIGSKREATAMNTASQLSKRVGRLEDELGLSKRFATVKKVEALTGRTFSWKPLKDYSDEHELEIRKVDDINYAKGVNAYTAESWHAVYGIELSSLCN